MTVPGGVPNLPTGALTIDTLASKTQDTSLEEMKSRAVERFSPIFNTSTGGSPANDLTPYGVIVKLFAGFNSVVANADPADVQGPEDLPQLLVNFIESLPLVGRFVDLNDAVAGTYEGDDETLLAIQTFFAGIRTDVSTFFTRFTQMAEIVKGQIITAYDDFVQDFKDWWASNLGPAALKAKADQNAAWAARKQQNDQILGDWFSGTYPLGSPSDTAATLVGGKRTKWGAWNDNLKIIGEQLGIVPPTAPLIDIGSKTVTGENAVVALSAALQEVQTTQTGHAAAGQAYTTNFNSYPDGPWPAADFPVTYTGPGSGVLMISGGKAVWSKVNDGDRQVVGRYVGETDTDYQEVRATIAGLPEGGATNYAAARMNAARDTFTFGRVFLSGLSLNWEFGYFLSGVKTVLASGSGAPLNFGFMLRAGVGGNPRRFQGISGNQVVFDYTDTAAATPLGAGFRGYGFRSETAGGGSQAPAPAAFLGCSDNPPVAASGSGFSAFRSATAALSSGFSAGPHLFPTGMFDTIAVQSHDLAGNGDAVTITAEGWYDVTVQVELNAFNASLGMLTIVGAVKKGSDLKLIPGNGVAYNIAGAQSFTPWFGGTTAIYCLEGDVVSPAYSLGGAGTGSRLEFTGDPSGVNTYWSIRKTS